MANLTGKGGFSDNPENINRNGRPPKGYSITEMFQEMLDSKPEVKSALTKAILSKALEGDTAAQRMIWQYMDGMPNQRIEHKGDVDFGAKEVADAIRSIIEADDSKTD